jgi:serine/threonine protein kinase
MTDRVGQHFGNYELVQLLGQGGCAEVYLGKHRYLNSYAALKVLHTRLRSGDEQKFLAEAQTLVNLRHPNIIHLLDFGIENGPPVLIMDYAPNGSLRQAFPQGTRIPPATVADLVTQIAAALQYAHNHHIIHRDVKPENILLDADNRLLLSDFGLSLPTPSLHELSTQDPAGTARYMAPEQLRGKPCVASDQYALAVMVYEWLCGEFLFHGNMWEIWHQHLYTDPPALHTLHPELPLTLETVVRRALAKKPQDRFVSIQAFARALARAIQTDTQIDENASQVTAPLQAIPRSSPAEDHTTTLHQQTARIPTRVLTEVLPQQTGGSALQHQNRMRLLRRVRTFWITGVLEQSLHGAALLALGLQEQPDAVGLQSLNVVYKATTTQRVAD